MSFPYADNVENHRRRLERSLRLHAKTLLGIIQELATNHRSTLFLCGKQVLTREMIKKGADCCQKLMREDLRFSQPAHSDAWLVATRIYRLVDLSTARPAPSMLNTALSLARQAEARDPRDKVFGILGLLDESISSKIVPHYTTSVQKVFADLTVAIIQATKNLEQVVYEAEPLVLGWPSWVPDLRLPFPRHNVKSLRERHASKSPPAVFEFERGHETDNLLLCCKAYMIDFIDGIAASPGSSLPILPDADRVHIANQGSRALHRCLFLDHPKTYQNLTLMKVPWKARDRSSKKYTLNAAPVWKEILKTRHFKELQEFREANKDFQIGGKDFQDFFSSSPEKSSKDHVIVYHLSLAVQSLKGRKLVTTRTGRIAMVPENVQKGDVVAVLLGCNFPVLLRPRGDGCFRVLGEWYVHGLMEGKVFVLEKTGKVSLPNLILC